MGPTREPVQSGHAAGFLQKHGRTQRTIWRSRCLFVRAEMEAMIGVGVGWKHIGSPKVRPETDSGDGCTTVRMC